jgi:hypothetical protein
MKSIKSGNNKYQIVIRSFPVLRPRVKYKMRSSAFDGRPDQFLKIRNKIFNPRVNISTGFTLNSNSTENYDGGL